jgi:uncharacterized protein YlxW (UPF0749 family)
MQKRKLNRATVTVVKRMNIRGRATAAEITCGLRTGKKRSFWRTAGLTFLGTLTVAGFFVPLPALADHDEDSHHGREDNDKGIRAEVAALQAQVASLQTTVSALQDQVNTLRRPTPVCRTKSTAYKRATPRCRQSWPRSNPITPLRLVPL